MNSSELHLEVRTSYSSSYDHAIDQSCFSRSSRQAVVPLCVRGVREHRGVHGVSGAPAGRMRGVRSRSLQGQATKEKRTVSMLDITDPTSLTDDGRSSYTHAAY